MALADARPLNLLLRWHDGVVSACLSNGHDLGQIAQQMVEASRLNQLSANVWTTWHEADKGLAHERLGLAIFEELIPVPIRHLLVQAEGVAMQLQINESLISVPWELAFDGQRYLGRKFALYRQLLRDGPQARARIRPAGYNRHLKVLILYGAADPSADQARAQALETRLDPIEGLSARVMAVTDEGRDALLRHIGHSDIVHCLGGLPNLLASPQVSTFGASNGKAPLRIGEIVKLTEPPRLLILEGASGGAQGAGDLAWQPALAQVASAAGVDTLFRLARQSAPESLGPMADFYAALASGQRLGEALVALRGPAEDAALASEASLGPDLVCYGDGAALLTPDEAGPHPDDHMRQVTVLCYDLVESTNLLRRLGAERYSEALDRFHVACARVVRRWSGQPNAPQGNDGVMCFFGLPLAHEDAPAMALRAALAMVDAVALLQLELRIGVVTGPVVVKAGVPMGEPIHLAARLQAMAVPGTAMVNDSTWAIVQDRFEFAPIDSPHVPKGFAQPKVTFRLLGEARRDGQFSGKADDTPWVGRQRELALLEAAWAQASQGQFTSLLIAGEAGIGKTRLMREFKTRVKALGHGVTALPCSPETADSAFWPMINLLTRWFGLSEADQADAVRSRLELGLRAWPGRQHIVAGLEMLLGQHPAAATEAQAPEKIRRQVIDALLLWLEDLVAQSPLCLIIEDHNWLDPSTRELLQRLLDVCSQWPLLLIRTERSGAGSQPASTGVGPRDFPERLELAGLSSEDTEAMLLGMCGETLLNGRALNRLAAKTDGVPLFIEETARALMARQTQATPGQITTLASSPIAIPGKVQDLLMARLDRLNAAKAVAQVGSVIGRSFSQAMVEAVFADANTPVRLDGVLFHLETLVRASILAQTTVGRDVHYHFRHALMQDAAYESLWERDRRRCHRTVARVISEHFPGLAASQPEVLARHCTAAAMPEAAAQYWENAARLAISRSAQVEASHHLDAALVQVAALPAGLARDRIELRLLLLKAGQSIALHGYGANQVGEAYHRAEALSRQCGDERALLRVQFGLEGYLFMRGEFERAHAVAADAAELVRKSADPMRRLQADWAVANLLFHQGALPAAVDRMDSCLSAYARLEQRPGQMQDPAIMCLSYSALAQWTRGLGDDALARANQAQALAVRLKHPFSQGEAYGLKAMLHCYRHEYLETLELAQRAIHVCETGGFSVWLAHAKIMHGWAVAHLGNAQAGSAEIAAGYALWTSTGAVVTCAFYLALQAEARALAGEPEDGLQLLQEAYALVTRHGERYFEPELCRLQGELLLHYKNNSKLSNLDKAQHWFLLAMSVAQELGMAAFEARAAQSLAALWQSQGRLAEAQALLASANKVAMIS